MTPRFGRRRAAPDPDAAPRRSRDRAAPRARAQAPARRPRAGSDPVAAAVAEVARALAGTGIHDEDARAQLAGTLPGQGASLWAAIGELKARRTTYLEDRAYRLLSAAVENHPVEEIDPLKRKLFLKERALGRMSLHDGFAHLCLLEPQVRDALGEGDSALARVAGPRAQTTHEILRSELAATIVHAYDELSGGGRRAVEDPTPFFERPMRLD